MPIEKLNNLERMLGNTYSENLMIRLTRESPYYKEIMKMIGNRKGLTSLKAMLNLN